MLLNVKSNEKREREDTKLLQKRKLKNKLPPQAVPNTWCKLVNSQITPCPKCKKPGVICSNWHMKNIHSVEIKDIHDIWRDIYKITKLDQKRITRNEITQQVSPLIQDHLNKFISAKEKILLSI